MTLALETVLAKTEISSQDSRLLVVAYSFPAALKDHRGPLTYIGLDRPDQIASADSRVIIGKSAIGLTLALEQLVLEKHPPLSFVFIDADHTISSLVRQLNAACAFSGPDTVFILPGAVPPERDMAFAAPFPGQAWWVGEVWTLITILKQQGAIVKTLPASPVGVLFATNVTAIDLAHAERVARELQESANADLWTSLFDHATPAALDAWLTGIAGRRAATGLVRVAIDPLESERHATTQICAQTSWVRPAPIFFYNLSASEIDFEGIDKKVSAIHGVRVDDFRNAVLPGRDIVLTRSSVCDQFNWHGKNYDTTAARLWMQHVGDEPSSDYDALTSLTAIEGRHYLPNALFRRSVDIDERVFFATPDEYPNFGMWLMYCVPGVRLFRTWKHRYPKFLAAAASPWQHRMLLELGVEEHELIEHKLDRVYNVSAVATMRQTYRSLGLARSDAEAFDEFGDRALEQGHAGPERIFVSRLSKTRGGGHRGLRNEEALIEALRPLGFVAVEPEHLSLAGQAGLFRGAKVVAGLGGAGMFNVAFCRPGTRVIDIESGIGFIDSHCNLFASRGTDYGVIIGRTDDDHPSPYQKTWTLNVAEAARLIARHT